MRKTALQQVYELAKTDERVVFIGSDIGAGTLDQFKQEMPERFFMEGVSEQHLIGMMTGLAMSGKIPYLNTIATFLTRRCFEQIALDAGLHGQKIRLIGSGGGTVYAPLGPTHLATDDIALMRLVPNMAVLAPCDAEEMKRLMPQTLDHEGPVYIRLAKGGDEVVSRSELPCELGKGILLHEGSDVLFVTTGITTQLALKAAEQLKGNDITAGVFHCHSLKPFDDEGLLQAVQGVSAVISVEEHVVSSGLGSIVAAVLMQAQAGRHSSFRAIGLPDRYLEEFGSQNSLMTDNGISVEKLVSVAKEMMV